MPVGADKNHRYPVKVSLHGFTWAVHGANIMDAETVATKMIHFDVSPHGARNGQSKEYYAELKKRLLRCNYAVE